MKILRSILFLCFFIPSSLLFADIINVPTDIDSIQGGINLASDGDTVLVQPGTYVETINFNGKNIVVGSLALTTGDTSYISQTVIDGDSSGSVVTFENGEDSTAVLSGFTVTNGYGSGGGIYIINSNPTIFYLLIIDNGVNYGQTFDDVEGGGIYLENSTARISHTKILSNFAVSIGGFGTPTGAGGGIYCLNSNPTFTEIEIADNTGIGSGGGIFLSNSYPTILNSLISNNVACEGGGICCDNSNPFLENVIIFENTSVESWGPGWSQSGWGGGIYLKNNSNAILVNVLINENTTENHDILKTGIGGGIFCDNSNLNMLNVTISRNYGAGIHCIHWYPDTSNIHLSNVTVKYNLNTGISTGSHTSVQSTL